MLALTLSVGANIAISRQRSTVNRAKPAQSAPECQPFGQIKQFFEDKQGAPEAESHIDDETRHDQREKRVGRCAVHGHGFTPQP